jgi:AraC-like DNA-binding protein
VPPAASSRSSRTPVERGRPGILRPADGRASVVPRRLVPSPPLRSFVDTFWSVTWDLPPGERHVQDVLVHPCGNLTVEGGRATVTGVTTRVFRRELTGAGRVVGLRFTPAGLSTLIRGPMAELTDRSVPAAEVLGDEAHAALVTAGAAVDLEDAVERIEAVLSELPRRPSAGAALVDAAVRHVVADPEVTRVGQLAGACGVTVRTLQRRFDRHLGVGPKWVIQRRRLHDALDEIDRGRAVDWAALALRLGFADQAHFVHAFTDAVGRSPSDYERS